MIIKHVQCCALCRDHIVPGVGGIQVNMSMIGEPSVHLVFHADCHLAINGTFTNDASQPARMTRWLVQAGWLLLDDVLTKPRIPREY